MRHKVKLAWSLRGSFAGALLACAVLALGTGCVPATPVRPPYGVIFTNYQAPLQTDMGREGATLAPANLRHGVSETHRLGLPLQYAAYSVAWGDAAIRAAAANGGITKVYFADYETFMLLGVYTDFRVHVYGE